MAVFTVKKAAAERQAADGKKKRIIPWRTAERDETKPKGVLLLCPAGGRNVSRL